MIKLPITIEMKLAVEEYCARYYPKGKNYRNPVFESENKDLVGLLGEVMVHDWQGRDWRGYLAKRIYDRPDGGYDIVINGMKFNIKTRASAHRLEKCWFFNFNVPAVQALKTLNKPDIYGFLFCAVLKTWGYVYISGYIPKSEFMKKATLRRKGDKDPRNNFTFICDAYNISITELLDPAILIASP